MKHIILLSLLITTLFTFGANDAPITIDDTIYFTYAQVHEFDSLRIMPTFLANDTDPNGQSIKLHDIIYSGANSFVPFSPTNQVFWITYKTSPNFVGIETFLYVIKDNGSPVMYDTGTVTMIVMKKDYEVLDANNVKATISKDVLFSSPLRSFGGFEAPMGSRINSIFASNLWVTGVKNGVVHSNIRKYGVIPNNTFGDDYTSNSGPVSDISHTDSLFNTKWDRVWKVSQHQIDWHLDNWTNPGYQPPQELLDWPAHGIIVNGEEQFLAPYVDVNNDTLYNPYDGDYPIIKGDQAIYFIYNDGHSPISLTPMVSEVHGMAYAFSCRDSALQNTIFVDYWIFNRSANTYDSTFVGLWTDTDLGNVFDDYSQCDVNRNLFFSFNGDDFDDDFRGNIGYGNHPGAQGILILKGANQDNDGIDNNVGLGLNETVNGTGFGDGIADNESWGMEFFSVLINGPSATPQNEMEYNNVLTGHDRGGQVWAADFYTNGSLIPFKYIFTDTSDPSFYGTGGVPIPPFTEAGNGNNPDDRQLLASTGPVTFAPGDVIELTYAFVFGRDYVNTGAQAGVTNMLERVDSIQSYYDQGMLGACGFPLSVKEPLTVQNDLLIYPNPTKDILRIKLNKPQAVQVEVIDVSGKVMLSTTGQSESIVLDLSSFTNGLYVIKATTKSATFVAKVIKK